MTYDPSSPTVSCTTCHGEGGDPGSPHSSPPDPCRDCGGSGHVPFVARTEDFLAALRERDERRREREAHVDLSVGAIVEAVENAVAAARVPARKRRPPPDREQYRDSTALYYAVTGWARDQIGLEALARVEEPFVAPFTAEQGRLAALEKAADTGMQYLAQWAVFRATTEQIEVYCPHPNAYASQGYGEAGYLRADCDIRVAVLKARGFDAETVPLRMGEAVVGYRVLASVPPELRHALPYWRLDDQRLLDATHPANLKVLFGGMFSYAGSWDWPAAKRERRDDYSFQVHRANEDAHLLLNRGPT